MLSGLKQHIRDVLALANLAPVRKPPFLRRCHPYQADAGVLGRLGRELTRPTAWTIEDQPSQDPAATDRSELQDIFLSTDKVHKWAHYFPIYERVFAELRSRPIRFLEIGVARGGSLAAWRRYFHPTTTIVGIDVDPGCRQFDSPATNVHVRIGGQQDPAFLRDLAAEFGPFDAVLDDGSHIPSYTIDSFRFLFASGLADGGVYLVEDVHSNYWKEYRDESMSFVDFACKLVDVMHAHYAEGTSEDQFRLGGPTRRSSLTVPTVTPLLESIEFHDSVVVIRRARGRRALPFTIIR
jgi:hypothetical protein